MFECHENELDRHLDEVASKHIPPLSEKEKHELLVWVRKSLPDGMTQRMIVKLAVKDRVMKLKHTVGSEGGQFDGSYPFAICDDPEIQEFLRGKEVTLCLLEKSIRDSRFNSFRHDFGWRVRITCQFHSENTEMCHFDPAYSISVSGEDQIILTKTDDYFLLQQRLMEQRKEELAALLLLTGPTKRVLPPSINPAKRKCA